MLDMVFNNKTQSRKISKKRERNWNLPQQANGSKFSVLNSGLFSFFLSLFLPNYSLFLWDLSISLNFSELPLFSLFPKFYFSVFSLLSLRLLFPSALSSILSPKCCGCVASKCQLHVVLAVSKRTCFGAAMWRLKCPKAGLKVMQPCMPISSHARPLTCMVICVTTCLSCTHPRVLHAPRHMSTMHAHAHILMCPLCVYHVSYCWVMCYT